MNRRQVIRATVGAAAFRALRPAASPASFAGEDQAEVMTVLGPIKPAEMGRTLAHEHILVDFIGADLASPDRYDAEEVFKTALPHLEKVRELGLNTLVECTPAHLGRDPKLLARLSKATGLHILTNTGYYAANGGKHLPAHARKENAGALAARWLREWREGIGGSGIRPGFIKIGFDRGPLSGAGRNLAEAAALGHLESGLTIAAHCGDGAAARECLEILEKTGASPRAFIWVHAQNESEPARHAELAARGVWIELDGVSPRSLQRHLELLLALRESGHLDRALISHDAGWYHVGEPAGGTFRSFETIFTDFLPRLREAGVTEREIDQLLIGNPASAFTRRPRSANAGP